MATRDELLTEYALLMNFDRQGAEDFLTLPPEGQKQALENKRAESWVGPTPGAGSRILLVLGELATIAGDLTGIGGAIQFARSL